MAIGNFSEQASAYERSRPGYPNLLIDQLISEASILPNDSVVEFGAGTGIFTRQLVGRGFKIVATEPNEDMMARAKVPEATWMKGSFEACPLPDQSQAWAVAAQAFHWAEPQKTLPEIHRILRPHAVFTVLWNNRAVLDSPVLKWTEESIRRIIPEFDEAYRDRAWEKVLQATGHFQFLSKHSEKHVTSMTLERYLELWQSHNRLNNIAGPKRFSQFHGELSGYLQSQTIDRVDVPYHCESWSVRRIE